MILVVGIAVVTRGQSYSRITLKGSCCCKFLMIPEGFAVNREKYKGAKKVQVLKIVLQELAQCILQICFKHAYKC